MHPSHFADLIDYNYWANRRLWACVEQLSEEQFDRHLDYSIGSIHVQVAHMMGVEFWWFNFLDTGELVFVTEEDCTNRDTIRARWDETERMVRDYAARLTPDELARTVKPSFWDEEQPPITVALAIGHILNHSTDHRAQTLAGLWTVGGPTTPQDVLFYHFDRAGIAWNNE